MRTKPTGYHVRHDLRPDFTAELLTLLHGLPDGQNETALQDMAEKQGYKLRQRSNYGKMLRSLQELGLIQRTQESINLTEKGHVIASTMLYQKDLLAELIHIIYYTSYTHEPYKRFSWSYQMLCDWLWDSAPCEIHRDRLVNTVSQAAVEQFDEQGISFSTQSISGILHWVGALNPPCIIEASSLFIRRSYCPVESFMLALYDTYILKKDNSLSIPLDETVKERVCRICLITPDSFSEMLDLTEQSFSEVQVWRRRGERLIITDFSWKLLEE